MWRGGIGLVLLLGTAHVTARLVGARAAADLSKAVPVGVYVSVIAVMGWCAAVRATAGPSASGELALAGALLFMLSDGLLATDRFARRLRAADAIVMTTYYAAQTLIALSVRG